MSERVKKLAEQINASDTWDIDLLCELCTLAGLGEEWDNANGYSFESIVYQAADILGVEII